MIAVSDKFKTAIKNDSRDVKGYVEILYSNNNVKEKATFTTNIEAFNKSKIGELFDGDRTGTDYASFEDGFFRLDGSLSILNDNDNTGIGFVSNEIYSNLTNKDFTITTTSDEKVEGMTLYFNDNIPTDLTILINNKDTYNIKNNKKFVQIKFNEKTAIKTAKITINSVIRNDWRIRLQEVDFGLTGLYQENELIDFTIIEQVSKLAEEMPINELNVSLNNYEKQFDPINPQGITAYLNSSTIFRPFIGVQVDDGIEYVNMGEYYLYNWDNKSDNTTTFTCRNILQRVSEEQLKDGYGKFFKISMTKNMFLDFVNSNYNYDFLLNTGKDNCGSTFMVDYNLLKDFLLDYALRTMSIIYADRNNNICIETIDNNIKETLHKEDLIENASFKIVDKINTVEIIKPKCVSGKTEYGEDDVYVNVVDETFTLTKQNEVFTIRNSGGNIFGLENVTHTGGSDAQVLSTGLYMAFVQITGNIGEQVSIKGEAIDTMPSNTKSSDIYTNRTDENEHRFVFDSPLNMAYNTDDLGQYILNQATKYEVQANYIGLPYITAGDTINIETEYGYKTIFVEKSELKFDGGLTGNITGVGN